MGHINVDFLRDPYEGQMKYSERLAMYTQVVLKKPLRLLEIGTWKGGGSTYILACAAHGYNGMLDTIEVNKEFYEYAINLYHAQLNILEPYVNFNMGTSDTVILKLLKFRCGYDFVLFDGAEDPDQTVKEYKMLNPFLSAGALIACHDWKTSKMTKMKQIITLDNTWHNIVSIEDTETGFQMFQRSDSLAQ